MNLGLRTNFLIVVSLTLFIAITYNQMHWQDNSFNPAKISELFFQRNVQSINESEALRNVSDDLRNVTYDNVSQSDQIQSTALTFNSSENPSRLSGNESVLMQNARERFNERKKYLKKQCVALPDDDYKRYYEFFLKERMLYEKFHNFLICLVAKSAASTWRDHLNNINKKHKRKHRKKISINEKDKISLSNDTIKVITVRHPIERLISAYRDKFGDGLEAPRTPTKKTWYDAAERMLKQPLGIAGNRSITFDSFVHIVLKKGFKNDRHFRSVYSNCVPCKIDYDFIVHQETFSEDLSYLFHVLNITESTVDVHVNESGNNTIGKKPSEFYLKDLNSDHLIAIYDLLWTDFFLFDYPLPNSIVKALNEKGRHIFM